MVKANGENAQISYIKELDCWIIASKNVGLMAQYKADLDFYKGPRYDFAREIGKCWFEILDKLVQKHGT
jgi:hypothetical protein